MSDTALSDTDYAAAADHWQRDACPGLLTLNKVGLPLVP